MKQQILYIDPEMNRLIGLLAQNATLISASGVAFPIPYIRIEKRLFRKSFNIILKFLETS